MKKLFALALVLCMLFALASSACAADKTLKVWVPDATKEFTVNAIADFMAAHPEYADYAVTVEAVGDGAGKAVNAIKGLFK